MISVIHDGLSAMQGCARVEATDQSEIPVAREQCSHIGDIKRSIHLGIPATSDIEMQFIIPVTQNVDCKGVVFHPVLQGIEKMGGSVPAHALRQVRTLPPGVSV